MNDSQSEIPDIHTRLIEVYFAGQAAEHAMQRPGVPWSQWKQRYTWHPPRHPEGRNWDHQSELWFASSLLETGPDMQEPAGFRLIQEWSDGYRLVWINPDERVILTYCEGDLSYELCPDRDNYRKAFLHAARFYAEH